MNLRKGPICFTSLHSWVALSETNTVPSTYTHSILSEWNHEQNALMGARCSAMRAPVVTGIHFGKQTQEIRQAM